MKSMSISLALLTVVPAHGFLTSPSLGASTVRASRGCITQWQSQRQRLIRHESKSTSLTMTNNFSKTVAAVALAALTIGASAIPFMFMGPESDGPKIIRVVDEDGNVSERGALTAMTRAEIQKKLSQVPVFFLRDESGAVHVDGEEGLLFMSPEDAKDKLKELKGADGAKVAATTLDDVWFPLLKKKGLNKKPVAAQASVASDLSARYRLVPRQKQTAQAMETAGWKTINDEDGVPVWAADSLAFRGTGSKYKMPLFTNVEDVVTSWERLKTEAGSTANGPTIQVSTIGAIVDMMEKGGADIRNLEFFADMEAMEQAEQLSL